jgi:hypothetical protein
VVLFLSARRKKMCCYNLRKLAAFLLTFSLSLFLTGFFIEDEKPKQILEKRIVLPEKENKKCSEKIFQEELNPFYQRYAELIQKRAELKLWLQNNENASKIAKSNQRTRLIQTEKAIIEAKELRDKLDRIKESLKLEKNYTPPQNLLYIENCYEF